ncbi:MAG: HesA/MoeB/ThiF family protein [Clostridia bacterium]
MDIWETLDDRYRRQIDLPEIGDSGQEALGKSKVLIVGMGGLGSPVAYYLAAAGVGHLTLMDNDTIAPNNLNRQILYSEDQVDGDKAIAAKKRLNEFNSEIDIKIDRRMIDLSNAENIIKNFDLVMSCVDTLEGRRAVNFGCVKSKTPMVDGAVQLFSGYVFPIIPFETACYNCALGDLVDQPVPKPVLGSIVGTIGTLMVTEAIKYLCDIESDLFGKMLICDFKELSFQKINVKKIENCEVCGK